MTLILESSAFKNTKPIPDIYTCTAKDISPPLNWLGLPENTQSIALIMDDPDAPDPQAPKMTWVHWVVYNIPSNVTHFPENMRSLPKGCIEGLNDWKKTGYGGPCPPVGRHRYYYKVYALDTVLPDLGHITKSQLEIAMKGHILAQTELVGTYKK